MKNAPIEHEMIPANLKPEFEIKKREEDRYHFRGKRIHVSPADPLHPFYSYKIISLRINDYDQFFNCDNEARAIQRRQAMGFEELEMIHNPYKDKPRYQATPGENTRKRTEAVAAEAEARRQKRIKDLGVGDIVTR